ncbi:MAG: hypothetical protein HKO98_01915, partial [Gemmatimonadetes bacterium]|nr:hypothetical protein [Gemmatimonadota bacterium]
MKTNHPHSRSLRLTLILAVAIVAGACGTVDPDVDDTEDRSFVTATQNYEVQQGETFTVAIVAFEEGSISSVDPPAGTTITPAAGSGLEVIGAGVLVDGAMEFTVRAKKEGSHSVDVSAPGTHFEDDSFRVEVRGTDISVESSLLTETTSDGNPYVPMIAGESTVAGFVLRGRGGCAVEGGASFGEADESGFDAAIRYAREFGPIRVAAAGGCPEADDGGVEAEIAYTAPDADATQGTVTYTIQADPVISKSITMLGIPGFDSRMVDVPTAVTGT